MRIKTPREKRILYFKTTVRWILYYLLILLSFIIMTSGTWMKPILLVPAAMCIAVSNGQLASAFTGAFCGMLIDIACGRLFGYNAVILAFFCALVSLMFELYLRPRFFNYLWITAMVAFAQCWLDYKFYYQIWDLADIQVIFRTVTMKVWLYTMISAFLIYPLYRLIDRLLLPKIHMTLEEAIRTN